MEIGKEIEHLADTQPAYSPAAVVKYFEEQLEDMEYDYRVHYANSTSVRLACRYADHYVWCNRGVNGIEGSLSTAVGHAAATDDMVFCLEPESVGQSSCYSSEQPRRRHLQPL